MFGEVTADFADSCGFYAASSSTDSSSCSVCVVQLLCRLFTFWLDVVT